MVVQTSSEGHSWLMGILWESRQIRHVSDCHKSLTLDTGHTVEAKGKVCFGVGLLLKRAVQLRVGNPNGWGTTRSPTAPLCCVLDIEFNACSLAKEDSLEHLSWL